MIDLGADFRFDDTWTYGLPERGGARDASASFPLHQIALSGTKRISNPGCYATGAQVGLMPLFEPREGGGVAGVVGDRSATPTVFASGVSGYSGAGTTPSPKNDYAVLRDNLLPYALSGHIHEREVSRHVGLGVGFMPHVAPFFQGISLTISAQLAPKADGSFASAEEVGEHYRTYYDGEPLIRVLADGECPAVRDNMHQHHVAVGGFTVDPASGRLALVATIDNLLKGAATQALQNINLALGMPELAGIVSEGQD